MRWKIGSYDVKYNPKSNDKSWDAEQDITTNMNGNTSNPNLTYNGAQNFTIDIYEKPTYVDRRVVHTGAYIALAEERTTSRLYLLKNNSTFDIKDDATNYGNKTLSGGSVGLPTGTPISICHMGDELAFLYRDATTSTILITDKNGLANRKYIYTDVAIGVNYLESIAWDFDSQIYAINPYGKLFVINVSDGQSSFKYEFSDYESNKTNLLKRYTSSIVTEKQGYKFIGVTQDKKDIVLLNTSANVVCRVESGMNNIADVSHSNFSGNYYIIIGTNVRQMYANTCRLDIDIIKSIVSKGQVTMYDELGFPSLLTIRSISVARGRSMHEAKYEVSFNGEIIYNNQSFNGNWYKSNRIM